jgi:hypothetical protein
MCQKYKFLNLALFIAVCWVFGMILGFHLINVQVISCEKTPYFVEYKPLTDSLKDFIYILSNNLFVALVFSVVGYVTFGTASVICSIYNGFLFSIHIGAFLNKYSFCSLYKICMHVPSEILAFIYFGIAGLVGLHNLGNIMKEKEYEFWHLLPKLRFFILPLLLLVLSAIIESDLLFSIIKLIL